MGHLPASPNKIRVRNILQYQEPPSWDLVIEVIQKSGLRCMQTFELAFGIKHKTLVYYKHGVRGMPPKYWHIFYDFDSLKKASEKAISKQKTKKKIVPNEGNKSVTNKYIADGFRKQHAV